MSDTNTVSFSDQSQNPNPLTNNLAQESTKTQLLLIPQLLNNGAEGWSILTDFLTAEYSRRQAPDFQSGEKMTENKSITPNPVTGKIYQSLVKLDTPEARALLSTYFPQGIISLSSESNIDYQELQQLLIKGEFQAADTLTRQKMCEIAGEAAVARKWVYFTEVQQFPISDLRILDQLWWIFSEGKFGFGVQRKIWLSVGRDFVKLWPKIGWKNGNEWTRYPNGFTWDLTAPVGHLPLLNQLRGVRFIDSLFAHPVWQEK